MENCLSLFCSNKLDFLRSVQQGSIELNSLVIGLVLSCDQSEIQSSFDLLEILLLAASHKNENLQTAVVLKFLTETQKFPNLDEENLYLGELFCKLSKCLNNFTLPSNLSQIVSKQYSKAADFILARQSRTEIFPIIMKTLSKNKKFLADILANLDDDLVEVLDRLSKVHYLEDSQEFLSVFIEAVKVMKNKHRAEIVHSAEFAAKKLEKYIEHHKNDSLNEISQMLEESKQLFDPSVSMRMSKFLTVKKNEESLKTPEDSFNSSVSIKVSQKPYTDEKPPEIQKSSSSFFDNFHFQNHKVRNSDSPARRGKISQKFEKSGQDEFNQGKNDVSQKAENKADEPKNLEKPKIKAVSKSYDDEEVKSKKTNLNDFLNNKQNFSETEIKIQIKKIISYCKNTYKETNKGCIEELTLELTNLSSNPCFAKSFYLEVKNCIQEDNSMQHHKFWEDLLEISKNFIEKHQIQAIKRDLEADRDNRTTSYNRRGRGRNARY